MFKEKSTSSARILAGMQDTMDRASASARQSCQTSRTARSPKKSRRDVTGSASGERAGSSVITKWHGQLAVGAYSHAFRSDKQIHQSSGTCAFRMLRTGTTGW